MNLPDLKPFQDRLILLQKQLWRLLIGWKLFHFWKISISILKFHRAQFQAVQYLGHNQALATEQTTGSRGNDAKPQWSVLSPSWRHEWELTRLNHLFLIKDSVLIKPNHSSIAPYMAVELLPVYWWLRLRKVIGRPFFWHYQRLPPITNFFLPLPQIS